MPHVEGAAHDEKEHCRVLLADLHAKAKYGVLVGTVLLRMPTLEEDEYSYSAIKCKNVWVWKSTTCHAKSESYKNLCCMITRTCLWSERTCLWSEEEDLFLTLGGGGGLVYGRRRTRPRFWPWMEVFSGRRTCFWPVELAGAGLVSLGAQQKDKKQEAINLVIDKQHS